MESSHFLPKKVDDPFPLYGDWPIKDGTLDVIEVGKQLCELPHAVPQLGVEDGLVKFMKEAWRCLAPGGVLMTRVPWPSNPITVANPLTQRYINKGTWVHFARPHEEPEDKWVWDLYGDDWGMRFVMTRVTENQGHNDVTLEKPE